MKNKTNISNITAEKFLGVLTELRKRMSGDNPVIPWENFLKFVYMSRAEQKQFAHHQTDMEEQIYKELWKWKQFYLRHFDQNVDTGIEVPEPPEDFNRLIVIPKGITIDQVWEKLGELFPTWKVVDTPLSEAITHNDREPTQTYAIWVRDRVEADEENKSESANDLEREGHTGMTLLERLIFELKYFEETGEHLDMDMGNVTLCTGSRSADGDVPGVHWRGDELGVLWGFSSLAVSFRRSRSVVS